MRVVELFAGVGGFRLGLERSGHTVVWSNEWDKYACDVYDKNFSGRPARAGEEEAGVGGNRTDATGADPRQSTNNYANRGDRIDRRDITTIPAGDIPEHDLIVGGFPCQAFSIAGKRLGFDEVRGTLFFDILRIALHHRTPYLLLENVKGLLNHDGGRTFETILRALDESGYDVQWQVLNSKDFGVPQNRERVIIVGHLRGKPRPEVFPLGGTNEPHTLTGAGAGSSLRSHQGGVDLDDQLIIRLDADAPHYQDRVYGTRGIAPTLPTGTGGNHQPKILARNQRGEIREMPIAGTIPASRSSKQFQLVNGIRRLTPVECERLQGFPDNWTAGVSDTQRYRQMGNAVTVNVIEAVARLLP